MLKRRKNRKKIKEKNKKIDEKTRRQLEKKKQKNIRKIKFFVFLLLVFIAFIIGMLIYSNLTGSALVVKKYFSYLNEKKYDEMYDLVETNLTKEEFVNRIKNIYEGIEAKNISITVATNSKDNKDQCINVTYNTTMNTLAGNTSFMNTAKVKEESGKYKIKWSSNLIFPDLDEDCKVKVDTLESKRGTIYDRNGKALAIDDSVYEVGIVPGKMNETTDIKKISQLLNISEETINNSVKADYVTDTTFVPLRKILREDQDTKNELLKIKGIMVSNTIARIYPYKNATSIMTGYIQDKVGKSGLEYAYNDKLSGRDGKEIYIEKAGKNIKTIIKKELINGEDINLTIDAELQKNIYEQYKEDKGCTISMDYNTGEILALVSTPSYDANKLSLGITNEEWDRLQNDENKPMYNRYLSTYAPGSTMKPIIGIVGLESGAFTGEEDFGRSGLKWQKDSSWKNLFITTLETYQGDANLRNALVYSDNIYFAKAALKIGRNNLIQYLNDYGFNDKIEFPQDVAKSTYGAMSSEASIANTGYGQAEVLVNPIHMAMIYSSIANGGNIVKPCLQYNETSYYSEAAIRKETADTIKEDLIQVVEEGTGNECKIEGRTIAGKTGTAEIKADQKDKNGSEIGWFNAFDEKGLLIVSMVENTENRGGSHYVVKKVRNIFEEK